MIPGAEVEISGDDVALFASDMHLGDHDRQTAAFFLRELAAAWPAASHVFLLGDLFEAWVGDDQPDAVAREAQDLFRRMTAGGCRLFAMRGNRDFLLDMPKGGFSALTGAAMLDDPCRVVLFGEPVVLAHADALCSDDVAYQRVREQVRGETWQAQFLARPLAERLTIARALRAESEIARARRESARAPVPAHGGGVTDGGRPRAASDGDRAHGDGADDVSQASVDDLLRAAGAVTIIHGHTHRCACHRWMLDGRPARRWVLPDWDGASGRGGFLRVESCGFAWQPATGR